MKSLKIILISTLLIIAGKGYSQQMNIDQDKNAPTSGKIQTEQESLNPSLIPEGKRMMQESSRPEGMMQSKSTSFAETTEEDGSPTLIGSPTRQEQSSGIPGTIEAIEIEGSGPTVIDRGNQKPDTH